MKKTLSIILSLTLCVVIFCSCTQNQPTINTNNTGNIIYPLSQTLDINNLDNCTVAISLADGDAYVDDSGKMQMNITAYTYDLYDMVDISALKQGDSIIRLGQTVTINSLERLETGLILINGGEEAGGFSLISNDSTVYYEIGMSDAKAYYELGKTTIPVSTEFIYTDSSTLDQEPIIYYPGDFLTSDAGIEYDFNPQNTSIVIQDGYIIAMTKTYLP